MHILQYWKTKDLLQFKNNYHFVVYCLYLLFHVNSTENKFCGHIETLIFSKFDLPYYSTHDLALLVNVPFGRPFLCEIGFRIECSVISMPHITVLDTCSREYYVHLLPYIKLTTRAWYLNKGVRVIICQTRRTWR